jgi:hypothetical protein
MVCNQFLKDLEKLLGLVKSYWSSTYSSMFFDEKEALKEFNISIQEFVKFSPAYKESIVRRHRQNDRLRLAVKYGPIDLVHDSGPYTIRTRKDLNGEYWVTTYSNSLDRPPPQYQVPIRIWGYGEDEEQAVRTHQVCLGWLDESQK